MKLIVRTLIVFCLPFLLSASRWTIDDILLVERAGGVEISRDGQLAVWVKSKTDRDKGRTVSHVMLRHLEEDWEVQLTRGKDANTSPRLSPDGRRVAFLSNRPKPDAESEKNGADAEEPAN